MLKQIVVASAALLVFQQAMAVGTCDRYPTSYGRTYCTAKLFVESDNELNEVYGSLRKQLDEQARQNLKNTQLKWIRYRSEQCENKPGSINVACSYEINKQRTEFLRDRLRECKTGSCNPAAAARQSW